MHYLRLLSERLVLDLELVLESTEPLQLPAELERREDRVARGECDEGGAGEGTVGVDARPRVVQTVLGRLRDALGADAAVVVRLQDAVAARQQDAQDLVVVLVRRHHDRRDVGRERARRLAARAKVALQQGGAARTLTAPTTRVPLVYPNGPEMGAPLVRM